MDFRASAAERAGPPADPCRRAHFRICQSPKSPFTRKIRKRQNRWRHSSTAKPLIDFRASAAERAGPATGTCRPAHFRNCQSPKSPISRTVRKRQNRRRHGSGAKPHHRLSGLRRRTGRTSHRHLPTCPFPDLLISKIANLQKSQKAVRLMAA